MASAAGQSAAAAAPSVPVEHSGASLNHTWRFVPVEERFLPQIADLEQRSYAPDEMCTPERFRYRFEHATPFFKVAISNTESVPAGTSGAGAASSTEEVPRVIGF